MTKTNTTNSELKTLYRKVVNYGLQIMGHEVTPGDETYTYEDFETEITKLLALQDIDSRIDVLINIQKAVNIVKDDHDYEWGYHCENCYMMLETEDSECGCIYSTRDILATLIAKKAELEKL